MPVAELLLSAFLAVLFERMTSFNLLQFLRKEGLYSKIKNWEKMSKMIQAVLGDAEEKQLTDRAVKMWLDDLRDLAYDMEDILDEFATEALARKLKMEELDDHHQANTSKKVRKLFRGCIRNWSPRAIKFNRSMESEIKDVTSRLEGLCKHRADLGLREIAGGISSTVVYQRPPSTSLLTEPAVYGRDQDIAKVMEMVLNDDESGDANFHVIPIVGMGGIGKTTLAQEVYNDNKAVRDFEPRAWVYISEDFDVLRISNAILESITRDSCEYKDLNVVQIKLKEAVTGKKFLLVSDDVWSKDYGLWETLKSPFMAAIQGSKIIAITRLADAALIMNPGLFYELKLLSDDDCWSLFARHAFECKDIATYRSVELIHQKVVEKCKGLPLAAKTLGGLLHSKWREDEWLDILSSKLWELSDETEIPAALKLSYHHLPSQLKRCFAYCAVLPKDYEFEEEELVHLWAEGLLQKPKGNKQQENLGHEYFYDLLLRSIFQQSSGEAYRYVMHDLVSDLAQWVSGKGM